MKALFRTVCVATLLPLIAAPATSADKKLLKHDDGSQESKRSMTGSGHAVRFDCPDDEKWYVTGIRLHGSRYGTPQAPNEDFQIVIANDDLSQRVEIRKPYSLFERGKEKWVRINFDPVEVRGTFHAAVFFNPTRTKGVYVGIDSDAKPTHSSVLLATNPGNKQSDLEGDWMLRAYVTNEIDGDARMLLDEESRAQQLAEQETSRDAQLLGDAKSITLMHDEGPTEQRMNIQGALYTVQFHTPKNVAAYVWQVQLFGSQFGGQHDSEAVSGDVYILDANRKIISRSTFPYSLATQQKRWISIPTLPTKVQGKFYVSVDAHGTKYKGLYMSYLDGNQQKLASTDVRNGDQVEPTDWSKKFANMQWLLRAKIADRPVAY
ncbi:MAG: hypothetical protein AAGD11_05290 [Planctomycetota bacterium]